MALSDTEVHELAARLWKSHTDGQAIPKLTNDHPGMTIDDAYSVQNALRSVYVDAGQRLVGWKAGLTSRAKMQQMGVAQPSVGFLTDRMARAQGADVVVADMVHPRVECEIAFVLGADLPTSGCTAGDVVAATAFVVPAIEIIDSRYENFKFDLPSVIADNSSSARFVVGSRGRRLSDIDRRTVGIALVKNGRLLTTAASAAVMGDPAASVALVADIVGSLGARLEAGMTVLSGGVTEAFPVQPGDHVSARFQHFGVVDINFV